MKNKSVWLFVFIVMAGLGSWIWSQRPGLPADLVLPSHPIIFARLTHVQKHVEEIIHSDFGKSLSAIDLPDVLTRNHFYQRDIQDLQYWQKQLAKFWANPVIRKFFDREAVLALYQDGKTYQVYIVLRLSLSTRIAELAAPLSNYWADGLRVRQERYHGLFINHLYFKRPGLSISYVRIRDLLVIVPASLGNLQEVVDAYQHRHEALQADPTFNFVRAKSYPAGDGFVFVNLNLFSDFWRESLDSRLTPLGYQTAAFPVYGLSYLPGVISKFKMIVGLDERYMSPGLRQTFDCPALGNDTLKLVPENAILYNWGICYDFERSWALARQKLKMNKDIEKGVLQFKDRLERHFQINIKKDVFPVLGHEIGGYLTDVDMQGTYPFPRFLIFVKIKDRARAGLLLDKLTQHPVIELHTEEYNNVNIRYVSLPLGANMDPGYAFLGDYLLVATSRQLLKKSIDAYNDSMRSIVSDDAVEEFSLSSNEKFNSVTLLKTAELSRRAQDFLGWLDKYLSGQVSMAAAYKQDGNNKRHELDEAIADKKEELILARKKLVQLKKSGITDLSLDDSATLSGAIENLSREESSISEDIASYKEQKEDLSRLLDSYALGAQTAKLTMYNMEYFISPVLKGLESIDTQAVTVRFNGKTLETEFLVK